MVSFAVGQMQILINEIDGERSRCCGNGEGAAGCGRKMDDRRQRTGGRSEVAITLGSDLRLGASTPGSTAAPALSLPERGRPRLSSPTAPRRVCTREPTFHHPQSTSLGQSCLLSFSSLVCRYLAHPGSPGAVRNPFPRPSHPKPQRRGLPGGSPAGGMFGHPGPRPAGLGASPGTGRAQPPGLELPRSHLLPLPPCFWLPRSGQKAHLNVKHGLRPPRPHLGTRMNWAALNFRAAETASAGQEDFLGRVFLRLSF